MKRLAVNVVFFAWMVLCVLAVCIVTLPGAAYARRMQRAKADRRKVPRKWVGVPAMADEPWANWN